MTDALVDFLMLTVIGIVRVCVFGDQIFEPHEGVAKRLDSRFLYPISIFHVFHGRTEIPQLSLGEVLLLDAARVMWFDSYSLVPFCFAAVQSVIAAEFLALGTLWPANDKIIISVLLMKVYRQQFVCPNPILEILIHILISIIVSRATVEAGLLCQPIDCVPFEAGVGDLVCLQ